MSLQIAHVIRDGGGTAAVELAVAAKLRERGHRVILYGPPEVRDHVHSAGFELQQLDWPDALPDGLEDLMARMIKSADSWARQLTPAVRDHADVVVADCAVFGARNAARAAHVPSAGLLPTVYVTGPSGADGAAESELRRSWSAAVGGVNRARSASGLDPVSSVTEQILDVDRLLVLTSRSFELPTVQPPDNVRYVGPQLPGRSGAVVELPPGTEPLVLVSLSTTDQGQAGVLQRIVTALRSLPVRVVITVGPAVDPAALDVSDKFRLETFVPHDAVLPHTDLVITHAGHGTVMAALSAGVPLVCLPMGRDQPAVADRVTHHGLGIRLDPEAGSDAIATAVDQVLSGASYRDSAKRFAINLEPTDQVVTEVESLASATLITSRDR